MKKIILKLTLFIHLFFDIAIAEVKSPAGEDTNKSGLQDGFLNSFDDYSQTITKETLGSDDKKYYGVHAQASTRYKFKTREPKFKDRDGKTFLRFYLQVVDFKTKKEAARALTSFFDSIVKINKTEGGMYDFTQSFALQAGTQLHLLGLSCLYSDSNANRMAKRLMDSLNDVSANYMYCPCGTTCRWMTRG